VHLLPVFLPESAPNLCIGGALFCTPLPSAGSPTMIQHHFFGIFNPIGLPINGSVKVARVSGDECCPRTSHACNSGFRRIAERPLYGSGRCSMDSYGCCLGCCSAYTEHFCCTPLQCLPRTSVKSPDMIQHHFQCISIPFDLPICGCGSVKLARA
jgi:hypothetical protein